jgi:cyclic beta-1,2-glucan synthetase
MYRAGIEGLLGIRKHGEELSIEPCVPKGWPGFTAVFRHGAARYDITVENPCGVSRGVSSMEVDGTVLEFGKTTVRLVDDGQRHSVTVTLGIDVASWPRASSGEAESLKQS